MPKGWRLQSNEFSSVYLKIFDSEYKIYIAKVVKAFDLKSKYCRFDSYCNFNLIKCSFTNLIIWHFIINVI